MASGSSSAGRSTAVPSRSFHALSCCGAVSHSRAAAASSPSTSNSRDIVVFSSDLVISWIALSWVRVSGSPHCGTRLLEQAEEALLEVAVLGQPLQRTLVRGSPGDQHADVIADMCDL